MLDVLVPVLDAMRGGAAPGALREVATASRDATRPMQATRGRASFLGERSIGHLDPGAASSCLLIHAVCDVVEAGR
jgi:dihydroxyacetone kinase-like protein